jgi:hypothetical protein
MELTDKLLNTQEDILYYTAKECGIPMEQMKLIEKDLWKAFGYYINQPHKIKNIIDLEYLLRFKVRSYKKILTRANTKVNYYKKQTDLKDYEIEEFKIYTEMLNHFTNLQNNGKDKTKTSREV